MKRKIRNIIGPVLMVILILSTIPAIITAAIIFYISWPFIEKDGRVPFSDIPKSIIRYAKDINEV